ISSGILHIVSFALNGHALLLQDDLDFLPDWGHPGKIGAGLAHYPTDATRDVMPIRKFSQHFNSVNVLQTNETRANSGSVAVHSHNDYWRRIPLYEALHYGCTGVEADVWHVGDDLFVGHSTSALTPNRTFRNLYVDPLIALLDKQNPLTAFADTKNHGVFDEEPDQTLVLLVDLKTDGPTTFQKVQEQLEGLRSKGYLTYFNGTHTVPGAITVVGTGNTPFDLLTANTTYRDIFYDAPLGMLYEPSPITLTDLDRKTTYELISSHGREEELLYFANVIDDYNYVLSYWVQRERWQEAMSVLKKQTDPEIFYQYSSVLMTHVAVDLVEVMMRQNNLEANKLIPALLNYNKTADVPLNQRHSTETAVHNTVVSIYAAHPTRDETALFQYLQTQSAAHEQNYDADFALRLCIAHQRVQSCVHIYCTMNQYAQAVDMALKHDQVDLAANVADRPGNDPALRKKLWLKVAKKVIGQSKGIKAAMEFLKRCELLRIEDLIPFFPDFVVIDDFKEEICAALEEYSRQIEGLKREMDESANTAQHIKEDIKSLDQRYAIVEPGEKCWSCRLPLLMRQFFVFPCQHSFHADCLGKMVLQSVGMGKSKRIKELQTEVGRAVVTGKKRERMVKELDALVAGACEMAVKRIDEPFVTANDNKNDWTI
ncbi:hypothetical protein D6C93_09265, partial [Aureobasidium pullulans]